MQQNQDYSRAILGGLQASLNYEGRRQAKHVYAGTVPAKEKARRRAANKVARQSRRASR